MRLAITSPFAARPISNSVGRDAPIAPYRHTCMGKARYKMWQGRLGLATSLWRGLSG